MDPNFNNMTIPELVSVLRAAFRMEDFDRVEEVLVSRDERLNAEIGELGERVQMESLSRLHAEEELRKKEEICERAKKLKESYEKLLKDVKTSGMGEIDVLRKKNSELVCQVNDLRKLKVKMEDQDHSNTMDELRKKNVELVCEVYKLRELSEQWGNDSLALAELRSRVRVLEDDKNGLEVRNGELEEAVRKHLATIGELSEHWGNDSIALAELRSRVRVLEDDRNGLEVKNGELEEAVRKHLATIGELRTEKCRLVNKKREAEILAESLTARFGELNGRVMRLEEDTKLLMSVDGGNNEGKTVADTGVSTFQDKDEEDVGDYEFGNDTVEPSRKNEDTCHSVGAAGTARRLNKGSKDAHHASSAKGRLGLNNGIEIIDLEDEDGDDDVSRRMQGKKDLFRTSVKNEHPSASTAIQKKSIFNAQFDTIKRKIPFSGTDSSTSSSSSDDKCPLSSMLLHPNRKKPRQTIQD